MRVTIATPTPAAARPSPGSRILPFYAPLALNAVLVTLVGPIVNIVIGRASQPQLNLAAFWIAFSILLFAQSACQALQPVTVALLGGRELPGAIAVAALVTGLASAAAVLIVARTAAGELIFQRWLPVSPAASDLARAVLALLAPLPVLVGLRGVAAGVVVAARRTRLLAFATVARLVAVCAVAVLARRSGSGALAAAVALLIGLALETGLLASVAVPEWRARTRGVRAGKPPAATGDILRLGAPLAVTAALWTLTRPVASAILGRLPNPDLALASFGVVLPIVFVTGAPLWALLDVTLVLPRSRHELRGILRFAACASLVLATGIGVLALPPLRGLALHRGLNLAPPLAHAVAPALIVITLEPWLISTRAIAQALLMRARCGRSLLLLSPVKILVMIALGSTVVTLLPGANGALLAVGLVLGADLTDAVLYGLAAWRAHARGLVFRDPRPATLLAPNAIVPARVIGDLAPPTASRAA